MDSVLATRWRSLFTTTYTDQPLFYLAYVIVRIDDGSRILAYTIGHADNMGREMLQMMESKTIEWIEPVLTSTPEVRLEWFESYLDRVRLEVTIDGVMANRLLAADIATPDIVYNLLVYWEFPTSLQSGWERIYTPQDVIANAGGLETIVTNRDHVQEKYIERSRGSTQLVDSYVWMYDGNDAIMTQSMPIYRQESLRSSLPAVSISVPVASNSRKVKFSGI